MPFSDASNVSAALSAGTLSQATVNALVAQILTQMFAFGMFDNPATGSHSGTVTSAAHQQTALELGEEGTVLLKNNGVLPLNPNPSSKESIAVIGTDGGADGTISGSSSTLGTYMVTVTAKDTEGASGTATFVWSVVQ